MVNLPLRGNFVDYVFFLKPIVLQTFCSMWSPLAMEALTSKTLLHLLPL